jgi:hypothetical protein
MRLQILEGESHDREHAALLSGLPLKERGERIARHAGMGTEAAFPQ